MLKVTKVNILTVKLNTEAVNGIYTAQENRWRIDWPSKEFDSTMPYRWYRVATLLYEPVVYRVS
jgi:hypothetical protein